MSKCAACGKGGDNLKVCTSCEQVSYCNAKCRKAHRSKHKKECRQYTAEIRDRNALIRARVDAISEKLCSIEITDEELFADPPPKEDCDICFIPMSGLRTVYQPCCGKTLCNECMSAAQNEINKGNMKRCCSFCRVPLPKTINEKVERVKKRMALNDANAFYEISGWYYTGNCGLPQDLWKAFEMFNRGAELGSVGAHCLLANVYQNGEGVEKDEEKAEHHLMLAATGGNDLARNMLGDAEVDRGNINRAMRHYMIAARCGWDNALKKVGEGYKAGYITKDEYAKTLRAHKHSRDAMKVSK